MKVIRWIINFISGAIVAIVFLYFVISLAVTFFILTGMLTDGQPMYIDLKTPPLYGLTIFQVISFSIISICILIRAKIGKKYDFKFLQPKHT